MITKTRIVMLSSLICGLLIPTVSATTAYATQYLGVTAMGANGVGVDLGIPLSMIYFYNWISLGFIFLLATSASERNSEFFALLIPIFAAMFAWWGWLVVPSSSQVGGIIICCAVIAVAVYIKGRQQAKFGIAGPGNQFLNIVFWMIIVQASIGFINASGLFMGAAATPNEYQNVQIAVPPASALLSTGGFFGSITSTIYLASTFVFAAYNMLVGVLTAIFNFRALILSIAPFLANEPLVSTMLTVITIGIDFIILVAMWVWWTKPGIGETV